jgi:Rieske Fe-S protein
MLACPCHKGAFSSVDGRPLAGPPTRRLPRILIEQRGEDLVATGIEV